MASLKGSRDGFIAVCVLPVSGLSSQGLCLRAVKVIASCGLSVQDIYLILSLPLDIKIPVNCLSHLSSVKQIFFLFRKGKAFDVQVDLLITAIPFLHFQIPRLI